MIAQHELVVDDQLDTPCLKSTCPKHLHDTLFAALKLKESLYLSSGGDLSYTSATNSPP